LRAIDEKRKVGTQLERTLSQVPHEGRSESGSYRRPLRQRTQAGGKRLWMLGTGFLCWRLNYFLKQPDAGHGKTQGHDERRSDRNVAFSSHNFPEQRKRQDALCQSCRNQLHSGASRSLALKGRGKGDVCEERETFLEKRGEDDEGESSRKAGFRGQGLGRGSEEHVQQTRWRIQKVYRREGQKDRWMRRSATKKDDKWETGEGQGEGRAITFQESEQERNLREDSTIKGGGRLKVRLEGRGGCVMGEASSFLRESEVRTEGATA